MMSSMITISTLNLIGGGDEMGVEGGKCGGKKETCTVLLWGDLKEGDHLESPGVVDGIILKWMPKT
jgi:hypothetical protein